MQELKRANGTSECTHRSSVPEIREPSAVARIPLFYIFIFCCCCLKLWVRVGYIDVKSGEPSRQPTHDRGRFSLLLRDTAHDIRISVRAQACLTLSEPFDVLHKRTSVPVAKQIILYTRIEHEQQNISNQKHYPNVRMKTKRCVNIYHANGMWLCVSVCHVCMYVQRTPMRVCTTSDECTQAAAADSVATTKRTSVARHIVHL